MKSALDVCQRLDFDAQVYGEYSQSIKKFSQSIWTFITTEVEAQSHLFSPLCQILDEFSDSNASICKAIRRSIEDLRDIAERNIVVQRKISEHALLIKEYENSKLKVEEAKKNLKLYESRSDFYLKKESLENTIKELENEQKEATRKARDGTLYLIEYKKKYANFTTRRIKSCFERLGDAFKTNGEESVILLNRYIDGLKAIKNGNPLPNSVLYGQGMNSDELNPKIKDSVICDNENEYILCEKIDDQNISNSNEKNSAVKSQDDNENEDNSTKNINTDNDNENDSHNITISNENQIDSNNDHEKDNQNNISIEQDESMSNKKKLDIKQNDIESYESLSEIDSSNQITNDSNENPNQINSNSLDKNEENEENASLEPVSNK